MELQCRPLDLKIVKLYVIVDSGYSTTYHRKSQFGMVFLWLDESDRFSFLHWASTNSQRVKKSLLGRKYIHFHRDTIIGSAFKWCLGRWHEISSSHLHRLETHFGHHKCVWGVARATCNEWHCRDSLSLPAEENYKYCLDLVDTKYCWQLYTTCREW